VSSRCWRRNRLLGLIHEADPTRPTARSFCTIVGRPWRPRLTHIFALAPKVGEAARLIEFSEQYARSRTVRRWAADTEGLMFSLPPDTQPRASVAQACGADAMGMVSAWGPPRAYRARRRLSGYGLAPLVTAMLRILMVMPSGWMHTGSFARRGRYASRRSKVV
jgi:hypothetical protein